jgi:Transposase
MSLCRCGDIGSNWYSTNDGSGAWAATKPSPKVTVPVADANGRQCGCVRRLGSSHVADHYEVGPWFVQTCLEAVASIQLAKRGLSLEESGKLPTPRFLGIDEFARRKGHRYDTILCDLEARQALEVSAGRKKDEVAGVLERLSDCDGVEAVSMVI